MRRSPTLAALGLVAVLAAACGDDEDVAGERAAQVRDAAVDAGLDAEVADVLALAARGATATFQLTYEGVDGASITVSQDPPNRRVDALAGGLIVQSQLVRGDVGYLCELRDDGRPGDPLECRRTDGAVPAEGAFTPDALAAFTEELAQAPDALDLTVEQRTIAGVEATCLVTAPRAGTPIDGTTSGVDTMCLSDDGAQLLVDVDGERVVASTYSTEVPDGTFDLPRQ